MHIINELDAGGAERVLTRIACHNARNSDPDAPRQIVVSLMDEGVYGPDLIEAGVELHCLGMTSGIRDLPAAIFRLSRLMRRKKPDAIMSWLYHSDFIATLAALLSGRGTRRLAWNIRCAEMDLAQYGRSTRIVLGLLAKLSGRPAIVAANSHAGQRHHISCGYHPRKWAYLPNGFDTDEWHPDPGAKYRLCKQIGITPDKYLIGMVARKDPAKDHATLFEAIRLVRAQGHDAHLVLIGHETDALIIPDELDGHVSALGLRRDVAVLVPGFDIAVLSSSFGEGFPNVIGEAMACGVPAIGNDVGDVADILDGTGKTVPLHAPDKLANAIVELLTEDVDSRNYRKTAARMRIIDHYSLRAMNDRYLALWNGLAGKRDLPDFDFPGTDSSK
ncbi:glycosyltransferase [Thalassospira sp. GO-4]|uniref:glycosyltransferase n=1 Tax=Thalassospira sp. GO-4 TaxID=2946605 RepID=UPI002023E723|nr:glycosyltransferase [Thalassospira sp. GO-4]URK16176.1 glycosyltransferase [Thalassospira sp. GO-4]